MLEQLIAPLQNTHIRYSDHLKTHGKKIFHEALKLGLEGIIAENSHSVYEMHRSKSWLKIKCTNFKKLLFVVLLKPRGGREKFGALILGVYENNKLKYVGLVGTGFSENTLANLAQSLKSSCKKNVLSRAS